MIRALKFACYFLISCGLLHAKLYWPWFTRITVNAQEEKTSGELPKTKWSAFQTFRLAMEWEEGDWSSLVATDLDLVVANRSQSYMDNAYAVLPANQPLNLQGAGSSGNSSYRGILKRGVLVFDNRTIRLEMGRQVISWGQGRLLNPVDLITIIDPVIVDIDSLNGSDLISGTWYLNETDSIQAVGVFYANRETQLVSFDEANSLLRYSKTIQNTDLALTVARHFKANVLASEVSHDFAGTGVRAAYVLRQEPGFASNTLGIQWEKSNVHQGVFGLSRAWQGGKLLVNLETYYNGFAVNNGLQRVQLALYEQQVLTGQALVLPGDESFFLSQGRFLFLNPWLLQSSISYQYDFLWSFSLFAMLEPEAGSAFIFPQVNYSLFEDAALLLAAQLPLGKEGSLQGEPLAYLMLKWYF